MIFGEDGLDIFLNLKPYQAHLLSSLAWKMVQITVV
jgi:hypothetical protein